MLPDARRSRPRSRCEDLPCPHRRAPGPGPSLFDERENGKASSEAVRGRRAVGHPGKRGVHLVLRPRAERPASRHGKRRNLAPGPRPRRRPVCAADAYPANPASPVGWSEGTPEVGRPLVSSVLCRVWNRSPPHEDLERRRPALRPLQLEDHEGEEPGVDMDPWRDLHRASVIEPRRSVPSGPGPPLARFSQRLGRSMTKFMICPYDGCGQRVRVAEPLKPGCHEAHCRGGHEVWIMRSEGRTVVVERMEPVRETPEI